MTLMPPAHHPITAAPPCPYCNSSTYSVDSRITPLGYALILLGFIGIAIAIALFPVWIGFLIGPIPTIILILGLTRWHTYRVCADCHRSYTPEKPLP